MFAALNVNDHRNPYLLNLLQDAIHIFLSMQSKCGIEELKWVHAIRQEVDFWLVGEDENGLARSSIVANDLN
jgi:hypothetical protein